MIYGRYIGIKNKSFSYYSIMTKAYCLETKSNLW